MISEPVVLDAKLVARASANEWRTSNTTIRWTLGEGDTVHFALESEIRPRHQIVKLVWTDLTRGRRARFVCPKSGLACDRLILIDGELASVKGHGLDYRGQMLRQARAAKTMNRLLGADGRGRARGLHRRRLLQKASRQINDLDVPSAMLVSASLGIEPVIQEKPNPRAKPAFKHPMAVGLRNGRDRFSEAFCRTLIGPQLHAAKGSKRDSNPR